ncbi:MAG TPA: NAD(P)H-dependent oxidoreductase subunit E [Candidatus Paceibacterota bacterium]|nr:NAD(P)H-dependent oxidoreductase subunit E [Verrucomicrobiota bacterium]HRY50742.1 NAD(P)H-dependent oxidoreductase subunit E [Candidatus Paceibacterota bacterium]
MTPSAPQSRLGKGLAEPSTDLSRLSRVLEQFKEEKGSLIPILQRTQDLYGYLPREAIHLISRQTRIPLSRIHGVATFYAQFHLTRRGRNLVRVCDGTACHVRGAGRNLEALQEILGIAPGETTPDYRLSLEVVYCLGSCGISPVALINNKVCARLSAEALVERVKVLE